jgi:DNA-binding IclR family transcriptional regulator
MDVNPKKNILNLLEKHPEGLTLQKIAALIGMNRVTITKFIHELMGEGKVIQRKVSIAKLCYLKEKYMEMVKNQEDQERKESPISSYIEAKKE